MSYFANTKCPKCGKVQQHHLGGWGFFGQETTKCSYCGFEYESVPNCMDMVPDRDDTPAQSSQSRFSKFTTEELEEELRRRKG